MPNETPGYPKWPNTTPEYQTEAQVGHPTVTAASTHGFPTIPGYEIVRELGRGGMGVVYEANQVGLGRRVAVKTIIHSGGMEKVVAARFFAEAQVVASIHHQHVVKVHDFGQVGNSP